MTIKVDKQRLKEMMGFGRQLVLKNPGLTHEVRNALENLDRAMPATKLASFASGAVKEQREKQLPKLAKNLLQAILDCRV